MVRSLAHSILVRVYSWAIKIKWWALDDYYRRLGVQAKYLYLASDLYKIRRDELGEEYALKSFLKNDGAYFFHKAQKEPFVIRWQHLKDSFWNRPAKPYVVSDVNFL